MALARELASQFSAQAAAGIQGSNALTVTAAGATQAAATALGAQYNVVTTATLNQGVILPSGFSPGDDIDVVNTTTVNICVYPPVGSKLNGNTTNAPCIMAPNRQNTFINIDGTNWSCDSI